MSSAVPPADPGPTPPGFPPPPPEPPPAGEPSAAPTLPPVLGGLMRGTFFLGLKTTLAVAIAFVSIPMVQHHLGKGLNGAYVFAWNFGFLQFLLEFGMSSALQRHVSETLGRGDRAGVNRAIACGMGFYTAMAATQVVILVGVAYLVVPLTKFRGAEAGLIVQLLWLQAITAPVFGLAAVISSVLQGARRYDFFPRLELAVVAIRFALLVVGLRLGVDFFAIVVAQTAVQVGLLIGPGLWVMIRGLGYVPHYRGARWSDFAGLLRVSLYLFLLQLSVVLADQLDILVLGFALADADPGPAITTYQNVSKPFFQTRQTGWTLAYLVMPAVVSLAAVRDERSLERVKYDGPRYLAGVILPVALLAATYAETFLTLWVGPEFAADAPLLRLFLVGTIPLLISVQVQMMIGMGRIRVVALAAIAGAIINLPLSYYLTRRIGVAGVIWGTVLTTLFSNLLIPGVHLYRVLAIDARTTLVRTLGPPAAGALALVAATWALRRGFAPGAAADRGWLRYAPFAAHLAVGCLAYLAGYLATPTGRADLALLARKLPGRRRHVA